MCYIGPNQASCFDCRFTSRMWYYFTYYHLTYITSNANQAQTQHISISVLIPAILRSVIKMQHHCRQLPAVSTLISTLAHAWSVCLHVAVTCIFFQCCVSTAHGPHAAVARGCCEGDHWPGEMEASLHVVRWLTWIFCRCRQASGWTQLSSKYREIPLREGETKGGEGQRSSVWFI